MCNLTKENLRERYELPYHTDLKFLYTGTALVRKRWFFKKSCDPLRYSRSVTFDLTLNEYISVTVA